jgi:hypothetical protein
MSAPIDDLPPMWRDPLAQGWSVFPVKERDKIPACAWKRWQNEKADPAKVAQWARTPCNVGIVTGEISGLVVLDLDSYEAMRIAEERNGGPFRTVIAKTGKGQHIYFRHPGGMIGNRAALIPGIDLRADGGFVVAPGSTHPNGGQYEWINPPGEYELAQMPQWLIDALAEPEKVEPAKVEPRPIRQHIGGDHPYCIKALEGECEAIRKAPNGAQERTLNAAALKMGRYVGGGGLSHQTAANALLSAALAMPSYDSRNPWKRDALASKIARGLADGMADPKAVPDRVTPADFDSFDPVTGEILNEKPAQPDLPDPVDLWGRFDPPELPQGLLPPIIEQFARVNAAQMGCDPAGLAMAALACCAAAIPDDVQLKLKRHDEWTESARIWVALVGDPSTKKSPILSAASGPICRVDAQMMKAWAKKVAEYDALDPAEKKGKQRPPQTRLRIEDATIEAAQQVLAGSPWGVLLLQDELSGFFGAMDKYGGGKGAQADRAFWLRSFNGGEYAINRVMRGAGLIPNLSVTMLGGIQPEPLRRIAGDAVDDGLLQRLFPIMLRKATMGRDEPMPSVNLDYAAMIEGLRKLRGAGAMNFGVLEFDDEAQAIRRALEAKHLELQGLESINKKLSAHIGKYDGLFARLCVIWHCVQHFDHPEGLPQMIDAETAGRVGAFLHKFLLAHAISFYAGCLGLSDDHDRLTAIAGHILAHKLDRVTNRDIARGDRTMRGLKDYEVRPLLEQLEALGWLDRTESPRPNSSVPHFAVNPKVHAMFADRAKVEAERRAQTRQAIAEAVRG